MYNLENVIAKINKAKIENCSVIISDLNKEIVDDIVNKFKYSKKYCRQICNSMLGHTKNFIFKLIEDNDKNIIDIISQVTKYYGDFYKCVRIVDTNNKECYPINKEILTEGLFKLLELLSNINSTTKLIEQTCSSWEEEDIIFSEFKPFTEVIGNCNLSKKEQFYLVMDVILKNINSNFFNNPNADDLVFYSINGAEKVGFTDKEAIEIIANNKYLYLINKDDKDLSELEKKQKRILLDSIKTKEEYSNLEIISMVELYNNIKSNYFDKLDEDGNLQNFSNESYNEVIDSLEQLEVTDKFLNIAKNILKKQIKNNKDKDEIQRVQQIKIGITDSEYKEIRKEIGQYFNMHDGIVVKPLNEEEVLYCASLMLKIGTDNGIIKALFDRGLQKVDDPIVRYQSEREKLLYFKDRLGIENEIGEMDDYYEEVLTAPLEDRDIWKDMLDTALKSIEYKLPKYEYELNKAKEYTKK